MASRAPPVLEYSNQKSQDLARGWRWGAYALAAVPIAAVGSVHLVYAVEWYVNGEQPIPPHHGADNAVEEVLYWVSEILMILFGMSIGAAVFLPAVALVKGLSRPTLVLVLPTATWLASFVLIATDPLDAMYFWVD
jgi:hypothetical protein